MKTWKIIVIAIASVIASVTAAFLIIHRRVIMAWIKGEELSEPPKWHPFCSSNKELPACCRKDELPEDEEEVPIEFLED